MILQGTWKPIAVSLLVLLLPACTTSPTTAHSPPHPKTEQSPSLLVQPSPARSLASFKKGSKGVACYDRKKEPYTTVVDAHFHPRAFGGASIPPQELFSYFDRLGVRFVNYFGIGQILPLGSGCTYYLDCPGVAAMPSIKNDFVNGMEVAAYQHPNVHVTLSMTFMDLAHPQGAAETIGLYDKEYPGMFAWAGELNVVKQALIPNKHEIATKESIDEWAPFMRVLEQRGIPVTLHSDLGNDDHPEEYLSLIQYAVSRYPNNKIVWAHAGLSKELQHIDPARHMAILEDIFGRSNNVMIDLSWDVLYQAYHQFGPEYAAFINKHSDRVLTGSDFVAAGTKGFAQYAKELETTSRINQLLDDQAFRRIALGDNYFRLLNLDFEAPPICNAH